MAIKQFRSRTFSDTVLIGLDLAVAKAVKRPVYTIIKHSATHYDLIHFLTREEYITDIPFKMTAERLMDKLNAGSSLPALVKERIQDSCIKYHHYTSQIPFLTNSARNGNTIRRHIAISRLDIILDRLSRIEEFLLLDDK